eukprot:2480442-Prymnesium_polylepis.3
MLHHNVEHAALNERARREHTHFVERRVLVILRKRGDVRLFDHARLPIQVASRLKYDAKSAFAELLAKVELCPRPDALL